MSKCTSEQIRLHDVVLTLAVNVMSLQKQTDELYEMAHPPQHLIEQLDPETINAFDSAWWVSRGKLQKEIDLLLNANQMLKSSYK